jgi:hypothetical protein
MGRLKKNGLLFSIATSSFEEEASPQTALKTVGVAIYAATIGGINNDGIFVDATAAAANVKPLNTTPALAAVMVQVCVTLAAAVVQWSSPIEFVPATLIVPSTV